MPWSLEPPDWRKTIAALDPASRARLAARARGAPLFAHAYAFHLNMRFGGMTPLRLADFTAAQRLSGLKLHVDDGEQASLSRMDDDTLAALATQLKARGLELHVETSTTEEGGLADAVRIALTTGATSLRCYPRYEGRVSQIINWTIADLRRLTDFDPEGQLRYTLEQHEDLKSQELVHIIEAVANPRLSLLFDFGNMINAYELPMPALAIQAPYITEVHVKDCLVEPDRGGWAHLACVSGAGHLPMQAMFVDLLLLGEDRSQILAFGLEEEEGYFAPALRRPSDGPDPFIPDRTASFTDLGPGDLAARLSREAVAAQRQVETIRTMLEDIAQEAERTEG
ncbi:sugar phosphate isomerase/epimerase [Shinella sp. CPCC 101442]|uniref:sugar phosphate isomerase/epimerase family protein n=1 Tax=Shinella sp. CPCC 101442 TaxID=2932265 RepID=UPI002152C855|nr:sugar phosphate isomerase/epimerase [Shinella sp. CPCC 101442]MCR6497583.1 sugar phosphate isomerase/epimerase [Shinella sp. CPCC 101442]